MQPHNRGSHDSVTQFNRRKVLGTLGVLSAGGLAGCLGDDEDDTDGDPGDGADDTDDTDATDDEFPTDTISAVVPWGPGGGHDVIARGYQPGMERALGVSIVVDNRDGASGRTGMNYLWNADPDGYTIGYNDPGINVVNESLFDVEFAADEFEPIGQAAASYYAIFTEAGRFEDYQEFIDYTSENDIILGTSGMGAGNDFAAVMVFNELGLGDNYRIVPMGSGAEVAQSPGTGDTDAGYTIISPTTRDFVEDGMVDVLLIDRPGQSTLLPDVPTNDDVDFDLPEIPFGPGTWAPPGVPDDRMEVLQDAQAEMIQDEEILDWIEENGYSVVGNGPDELLEVVEFYKTRVDEYEQLRPED